ncbi:MAG: radical SAM protein [Lachnospiraceae bacterium]|nr:radical SAM protein [Lachnospiraceae bacterium]
MLIDITYHCSMGCSHCMADCYPDNSHMSPQTFKDVLEFIRKHNIPGIHISGGEIFEHPQIKDFLDMIAENEKIYDSKMPVALITNGRKLSSDPELLNAVQDFQKKMGKGKVLIQVTDDPRFYPEKLDEKQKYRLKKLGALIDTVPGDPKDPNRCLYPQGRALENFDESWWRTNAPKCVNTRFYCVQRPNGTFHDMVMSMVSAGKLCTPVISPKGEIKLGESKLCPPVASIYDSDEEIMKKIKNSNCSGCQTSLRIFREKFPELCEMIF